MSKSIDIKNLPQLWASIKDAFEWDGSWRDIYILNTSSRDWDAVLAELKNESYNAKFFLGGEQQEHILSSYDSLKKSPNKPIGMLSVDIEGVQYNAHFFTDEELEFDIDPRQVTETNFPQVCDFLVMLSRITGKECLLTDENWINFQHVPPILKINAAKNVATLGS